jgi:hypothetical protein
VILRPGKTPSGKEACGYLRRLCRRIRRHWPTTRLTIRGDGHYGRPELMDFCEKHGLDYLFGVTGTKALAAKIEDAVDPIRVERAETSALAVRGFAETKHTAAYWLMLTVRDAVPKIHALAKAEFATLRLRLLKIGARIRETAHRVRIAFAAA